MRNELIQVPVPDTWNQYPVLRILQSNEYFLPGSYNIDTTIHGSTRVMAECVSTISNVSSYRGFVDIAYRLARKKNVSEIPREPR